MVGSRLGLSPTSGRRCHRRTAIARERGRARLSAFVHRAAADDRGDPARVADVGERIGVEDDQIGQKAFLDLDRAELRASIACAGLVSVSALMLIQPSPCSY